MKPIALLLCLIVLTLSADKQTWRNRTIYQLLTDRFARGDGQLWSDSPNLGGYQGGTYRGIINNLDYIQGMGFDAIWISPIIDNYPGGYHGYKGRDLYKLNQNYGTEKDFVDFVEACHERDIYVMVDVVANHMGNLDLDFSQNVPFNQPEHYHDYCVIENWNNQAQVQNCRLSRLADLKQENDYVRTTLLEWIKNLVIKYKIDGLRIDTVPQVPKWFWEQFSKAAGVYNVGQVFNGDINYVGGYVGSVDAVLNYPFFFTARDNIYTAQGDKSLYKIRQLYQNWKNTYPNVDLNYLANFCDNHDNARYLSWGPPYENWESKKKFLRACNTLALTAVGIPIVYYGTEQYFAGGDDPNNRQILWRDLNRNSEMYQFLTKVITARKQLKIWDYPHIERYADDHFYSFSRGKMLVALTNQVGGTQERNITYHPYKDGEVICNIFYELDCIKVPQFGFNLYLLNGQVKVYIPKIEHTG